MAAPAELAATADRLGVPGYARDAQRRTCLPAELPFFNDPRRTEHLARASLEPILETLPARCRVADLGGADGYVARAFRDYLAGRGIGVEAVVVDANPESLRVAQKHGLSVVPGNLETVRLRGINIAIIRLVMQYNSLAAQKRILMRAFECLVPRGVLILQAETGTLPSVLFRNLLSRFLQHVQGADSPALNGRWVSTRGLARLVGASGFSSPRVSEDFLVFETQLEDLLRLAWTRFYGTPTSTEESRRRFDAFRAYANTLATRLLERGVAADLTAAAGTIVFSSRHALIVATKLDSRRDS